MHECRFARAGWCSNDKKQTSFSFAVSHAGDFAGINARLERLASPQDDAMLGSCAGLFDILYLLAQLFDKNFEIYGGLGCFSIR